MPETRSPRHERQAVHKRIKCLGPEESRAGDSRVLCQEVTLPAETQLAKPEPGAKYQLWALSLLPLWVSQISEPGLDTGAWWVELPIEKTNVV